MKQQDSLPRICTVADIAQYAGIAPLTYRRKIMTRKGHPKPLFPDQKPLRFRSHEVVQFLGLEDAQ
mgnify:FL=1